jgi:hypothetical protein
LASLRSGFLLAFGLQVPGQELVDPLGRMILQTREDVGEPSLRIDIVEWRSGSTLLSPLNLLDDVLGEHFPKHCP